MRTTQFPLHTLKEAPADAEVASHRLMLRAGMVRQAAAGIYSWLPMGLRVLRKVERIVREEMNRAGAVEVLMPAVQPAELWQESGRWEQYGAELLRLTDRQERAFCFGPTHEEVITDIARREIRSYRQLPVNYYQIQTKFRDEIRPRFGVMRAREFLMKDAYSFHLDQESLAETYQAMYDAYGRIFSRVGLEFRAVAAHSGSIGGSVSHEFHVPAECGEDVIAYSDQSDYAANLELAECVCDTARPPPSAPMQKVATERHKTIAEVSRALGVAPAQCVKTLLVKGAGADEVIALALRGDHELNATKAAALDAVAEPLAFADEEGITRAAGCRAGCIGPLGLKIPLLVDRAAAALADFVCGANEDGHHYTGVNWGRDLPPPQTVDIRNAQAGDPSPDGKGRLVIARGIEVGHVFQLGAKYSEKMAAQVLDENGKAATLVMGCYGIGISRIVAAAIEHSHDERGIVWPAAIAPFQVALAPVNMRKSTRLREATEKLYAELRAADIETLYDDRNARPGVIFADMELIGIPHRIVISDSALDSGTVEYQGRRDKDKTDVPRADIVGLLREKIGAGG